MARAVITNAAGPTEFFFHNTGMAREESVSETRLVLSARIIDGPFKGERSTMTFIGTFDLDTGFARVSEVHQAVDGRLHFLFAFDRPLPLDADFPGEFREPITLIGNRFATTSKACSGPTGSSATPAPTSSSACAPATRSSAASARTSSSTCGRRILPPCGSTPSAISGAAPT